MKGLSPESLFQQWSGLLPRGAVLMSRRGIPEDAETALNAEAAPSLLFVIAAVEHHGSPFLVRMLGSIGLTSSEYHFVDYPHAPPPHDSRPVLFFQDEQHPAPAHASVFALPDVAQIQKDTLAKRAAWEELKRLAKALGKHLPAR